MIICLTIKKSTHHRIVMCLVTHDTWLQLGLKIIDICTTWGASVKLCISAPHVFHAIVVECSAAIYTTEFGVGVARRTDAVTSVI